MTYPRMTRLKRIREAGGLSQADLAAKIGGHLMTISKLERGERAPSMAMLARLARALDVHPALLLEDAAPGPTTTAKRRRTTPRSAR